MYQKAPLDPLIYKEKRLLFVLFKAIAKDSILKGRNFAVIIDEAHQGVVNLRT